MALSQRALGRPGGLLALALCLTLTGCVGSNNSSSANKDAANTSGGNKKTEKSTGPEAKLAGVWVGSCVLPFLGDAGKVRYEIKANGRYSLTGLTGLAQLTYGATPVAGTWNVTGSDGDVIIAKATDDLHPKTGIGWRITVKGDDEIILEDPEGSTTLKRKKPVEIVKTPFGVGASAEGADVEAFARAAHLPGDQKDHNAANWAEKAAGAVPDSINGKWSNRFNNTISSQLDQAGERGIWYDYPAAEVQTDGKRVYMLIRGKESGYLLVLLRDGNKLRGRYVELNNPNEPGLFAGVVVDDQRIDGVWEGADGVGGGRWDFRR